MYNETFNTPYIFRLLEQKNHKSNLKALFSIWTRIKWIASSFGGTIFESGYDMIKWKKKPVFYDLRQLTNLPIATWEKLNLSRTSFISPES